MSKIEGWIVLPKQNSWLVLGLIGYVFSIAVGQPVVAQVESDNQKLTTPIPRLSEVRFPASNVKGLLSQSSIPTNRPSLCPAVDSRHHNRQDYDHHRVRC